MSNNYNFGSLPPLPLLQEAIMSDETKIDYDAVEAVLKAAERWLDDLKIPPSVAAAIRDARVTLRQLTVERERMRILETGIEAIRDERAGTVMLSVKQYCDAILRDSHDARYAPNNPCPDCGATDRAHTCLNWRESESRTLLSRTIERLLFEGWVRQTAREHAETLAGVIIDAIDARLARGK